VSVEAIQASPHNFVRFKGVEVFPGVPCAECNHAPSVTRCGLTFVGTASLKVYERRVPGLMHMRISYTRTDQTEGCTSTVLGGAVRIHTLSGSLRAQVQGGLLTWSAKRVSWITGGEIVIDVAERQLQHLCGRLGEYFMVLRHPNWRLPAISGGAALFGEAAGAA